MKLYRHSDSNDVLLLLMNIKHKLEYTILRSTIFFINLLPVPVILFLCSAVGYVAWVVFPFRIKVAYKNLSTVFPEMDHPAKIRLLRRVYLQFTRTFGLVFILHRKSLTRLVKNARITGREKLDHALGQGKGVILTTIHASWFEAYFAWFNLTGLPTSLIYKKQSNPLSDEFFVRQRRHFGSSLEQLSSYEGMTVYQEALAKNRLLIVSLDQSYTGTGTSVKFFNQPLACAKGSALLHLRSGAPVMTSVYYMQDGELHIDFDTVDLPEYSAINEENINDISTRCIQLYEPFVRQHPEQWFSLFHRLWSKTGYTRVKRSLRQIFF
ncbi:lysophospholipid acyltransferase family protein [Desulfopila sp. IMCC35006]|uniref:lysophospholipid acyltransferase family protein n=1 Tax=Desulfopila sp. IMCC35006 TaxID=2569542 RepID=UPI00142E97B7|nr:lysophospholipid acyltransferase family protein [Desulfopila sp. IMCC35006]